MVISSDAWTQLSMACANRSSLGRHLPSTHAKHVSRPNTPFRGISHGRPACRCAPSRNIEGFRNLEIVLMVGVAAKAYITPNFRTDLLYSGSHPSWHIRPTATIAGLSLPSAFPLDDPTTRCCALPSLPLHYHKYPLVTSLLCTSSGRE